MSMLEKLTYLKRRERLTTEEIAARSELPVGTLNKIFAGQTKSPGLDTMARLCQIFHVPIEYLLDDDIPTHCTVAAYAEDRGMFLVTAEEAALLLNYRRIPPGDRRCTEQMVRQFILRLPDRGAVSQERLLPCYVPVAEMAGGVYTDAWRVQMLRVPVDRVTQHADFAVMLINDELSPIYEPGDVLAVREGPCEEQHLGCFFLNGEGYIRKLQRKRGEYWLVSVNTGVRSIRITGQDELHPLGQVLGSIRECRVL